MRKMQLDDKMIVKLKRIIVGLCLVSIFSVVIIYFSYTSNCRNQDRKWLEFGRSVGFLALPSVGIESYSIAIESLRPHLGDIELLHGLGEKGELSRIPKRAVDQFIRMVVKGAKARRLGIKIREPEPFSTEIYTPNNERIELEDIKLLAEATARFARVELTQKGDVDTAVRLGYANVALGTQLSMYDVDFVHMYGIACKTYGLQTLEECAKAQSDSNLMGLVSEMREELNEEFEVVKNMPATVPSFWDFFTNCLRKQSD